MLKATGKNTSIASCLGHSKAKFAALKADARHILHDMLLQPFTSATIPILWVAHQKIPRWSPAHISRSREYWGDFGRHQHVKKNIVLRLYQNTVRFSILITGESVLESLKRHSGGNFCRIIPPAAFN